MEDRGLGDPAILAHGANAGCAGPPQRRMRDFHATPSLTHRAFSRLARPATPAYSGRRFGWLINQECLMKKLLITIALASSAGLALAHNCPNEMKAIDAKLATNPQLSSADAAKVKQLRADGEAQHKAGKHDDSMKTLGEAKKILGI
jgi:hypothetical protein